MNTRRDRDIVPRWLNHLVVLVTAVLATIVVLAGASIVRADELPPGYVEPPGPCVQDPESGLWSTSDMLPCGPTLAAIAAAADQPVPVDPVTGCTPAASSDGCAPAAAQIQTNDGCVGPDGYCTTEPPTTTAPPQTTEPPATTTPAPTAPPATTEPPTTTAPPATTEPATTTSVAVGPPPTTPELIEATPAYETTPPTCTSAGTVTPVYRVGVTWTLNPDGSYTSHPARGYILNPPIITPTPAPRLTGGACATTTTAASSAGQSPNLPTTGSNGAVMSITALGLLAAGTALVAASRRRSA